MKGLCVQLLVRGTVLSEGSLQRTLEKNTITNHGSSSFTIGVSQTIEVYLYSSYNLAEGEGGCWCNQGCSIVICVMGLKHGNHFSAHRLKSAHGWPSPDPAVGGALCFGICYFSGWGGAQVISCWRKIAQRCLVWLSRCQVSVVGWMLLCCQTNPWKPGSEQSCFIRLEKPSISVIPDLSSFLCVLPWRGIWVMKDPIVCVYEWRTRKVWSFGYQRNSDLNVHI